MNSTTQISETKNQILNKILDVASLFLGILFIINLVRAYNYGFDLVNLIYILIVFCAYFVIFNKNKIAYDYKLLFFIFLQLISSTIGIFSFGVLGTNFFFFISSVICTSLFSSSKNSNIIFISGISIYFLMMILYVNHYVELRFDTKDFAYKISNWLNLIFNGSIVIIMLKTIVEELLGRLVKLNYELENKYQEVKLLNDSLEDKVTERTQELKNSNKEKDKILGILSHDVNNRIGGIGSLLELLDCEEINSEEQKEFIQLASETCKSTSDIIRDLLEYSKNLGNQDKMFFERVNIYDFLKSSIELHQPRANKKSIRIVFSKPDNEIFCDLNKLKFSRVMDNLLSNAIKFTRTGGSINLNTIIQDEQLLITVNDNGIGIPDSLKDKLFIPFSGSGRQGTSNEESNGLGLSIVKKIVEKHNGKIWFESIQNEGTSFFISIPKEQPIVTT